MAEQMNIGRFEANLIIALIQHRLNETGAGAGSATQQAPQVSFSLVGLLPLITFLFVQSAIVWGIWHAIH